MKTALQLYSIRTLCEKDFKGAIKDAALAGYDGVEFAGFYGLSAEEAKAELEKNGLMAAGTHISLDQCDNDLKGLIEFNKKLGVYSAVIPYIKFESYEDCVKYSKRLNEIGKAFTEEGIVFGYHNHHFEFQKFNDKYVIDHILENTDPRYVKWEMDTHWVYKGGEDPSKFPAKYKDRLPIIHCKDVASDGEDTEAGSGILDYPEIVKTCGKVEWLVVEQESFKMDMLESIKISCDNLKNQVR